MTEDKAGEALGGNTGNLYAQLPGSTDGEPVLFSAHMDRVGNHGHIVPLVKEEEGKIVSDGTSILAGDDIGGVAAILAMLREVKEKQIPHGPIEVAFSVCEETGVEGSRQYDFQSSTQRVLSYMMPPARRGPSSLPLRARGVSRSVCMV